MSVSVLHIGDNVIHPHEVPFLVQRYQLMSQIWRGIIIDRAIADITYTEEERQSAIARFCKQQQIFTKEAQEAWRQERNLTPEQMEQLALRPLKIEKFKTNTWKSEVGFYFLARKASLDQVIYSLIRIRDLELANEIYFRIQEGEESFAQLARQYSQGPEADIGGILGSVPLGQLHPTLSKLLYVSKPGQLWSPRVLGDWIIIVRLEKLIPVQLDDMMHHRLINELFENWLQGQLKKVELLPCREFWTA